MKLINLFLIILVVSASFSCKKKTNTSEEPTPEPQPAPVISQGEMGLFKSDLSFNDYSYMNGGILKDSAIYARFFASDTQTNQSVSAGTLTVNGATLTQLSNPITYYLLGNVNMHSLSWSVSGSGTVSASSFSYIANYPVFNGSGLLPDTVSKSTGANFTVSSVSNYSGTSKIEVSQWSNSYTVSPTNFPTVLNITPTTLANFSSNSTFNVQITLTNHSQITLNGKKYGVEAVCLYSKIVYLKP